MKRVLTMFLVLAMVVGILPAGGVLFASAEDAVVASGYCGADLTWTLEEDGTLVISGTGAMENYANSSDMPWYSNRNSIKSVVINDGVTAIGDGAFFNCAGLASVTISDSVEVIGAHAFVNCDALTSVTVGDGVTTIGESAFADCTKLVSVTIGDGVTTIGDSAFSVCTSLKSVIIPDSVEIIGEHAFDSCRALTSVVIGNGVTTIGDGAFYSCTALSLVTMGRSVETIGNNAFYYCRSVSSITLPDGVTTIGSGAFGSCNRLSLVHYIGAEEQWGEIEIDSTNLKLLGAQRHYMEPEISSNGDVTHTCVMACSDCEVVYENAVTEPCTDSDEDETCDICQGLMFAKINKFGANMTLGNELVLNVIFYKPDVDAIGKELTAYLTHHHPEKGDQSTQTELVRYGTYYYKASFKIAAKQMADVVSVELRDAEGTVYSNPCAESAKSYLMRTIDVELAKEEIDDRLMAVLVDTLNYGAAAQEYFKYNQDNCANADLTQKLQAYATPEVECTNSRVEGDHYHGSFLSLEDRLWLKFVFDGDINDGYTAELTFTNYRGEEIVEENGMITTFGEYQRIAVTTDKVVVADGFQLVTVTVYDAEGKVYGTVTDSVESYVARTDDGSAVFGNIMKFVTSAREYFLNRE